MTRSFARISALVCVSALVVGCAHSGSERPSAPQYSPAQLRARAGVWGGPETLLAAEAMAYSASRSPWVETYASEHGRIPRVRIAPLHTEATEPALAAAFDRDVAQAMTNTGRLEIVEGREGDQKGTDAQLHTSLDREDTLIEGQRALRYRLTMRLLADQEKSPLWQRSQIIKKWTTQPVDTQTPSP